MAGADTIDVRIRLIDEASKGMRNVQKETKGMNKAFGELKKLLPALGFAAVAKEVAKFTVESTKLAARVETLGVVTQTLGKNAGISAAEIRRLEQAIQSQGITTQASRQALAKMMQAQLDVADAADLARLAQDAAVIAGINSSEAFERLVNVIASGNVRMARTMGLQVDFNAGYAEMAVQLGKATEDLTAQEKAQARSNTVMAQGAQIAGAYAEAMETVGKQVTSTPRYWEEFMVAFGEANVETLGAATSAWQQFLANQTRALEIRTMLNAAEANSIITETELLALNQLLATGIADQAEVHAMLTARIEDNTLRREHYAAVVEEENRQYQRSVELHYNVAQAMAEVTRSTTYANIAQDIMLEGLTLENIARWEQVAALEAQKAAQDALAGGLRALAPQFQGGFTEMRDIDVYALAGGAPEPRAAGGPLSGFNLVGEAGPEMIIGNQVIPARQTRQMMNAGIRPGRRFETGGEITDFKDIKSVSKTGGMLAPIIGDIFTTEAKSDFFSRPITGEGATSATVATAAETAAASVGFIMSQNITTNNSMESAKQLAVNSRILEVLESQPSVEDMYQIMRDVLGTLIQ